MERVVIVVSKRYQMLIAWGENLHKEGEGPQTTVRRTGETLSMNHASETAAKRWKGDTWNEDVSLCIRLVSML